MELPIYKVDAFASGPLRGNPAAICPLDSWLSDAVMQSIAEENNLAETAFYVPEGDGFRIRWFTPSVEVDLCGHATLAAAAVAMRADQTGIVFDSRSGKLSVARENERYTLDLPSLPATPCAVPAGLYEALGAEPSSVLRASYCMCVFEHEDQIRSLAPNMFALLKVECFGVIVTAPGKDCDFVSRMFA